MTLKVAYVSDEDEKVLGFETVDQVLSMVRCDKTAISPGMNYKIEEHLDVERMFTDDRVGQCFLFVRLDNGFLYMSNELVLEEVPEVLS